MSLASYDGTRLDLPWCLGPMQLLFSGKLALGMGDVAVRASTGGGAQAGGEGRGSMSIHCALLPSPLLPFTVCVRSLSGVLWWAGVVCGGVAVAVLFALWRLLCCLLLLYDCGLGRD